MHKTEPGPVSELEVGPRLCREDSNRHLDLTLWQSIRKWPKVIAYSLALTSAILLWGFDTSIVGNVSSIPAFQRDYGRAFDDSYIIPSMWMGLWNAVTPIGIMGGSIVAGGFQDRFGRRISLATGSLVSAVAVAMVYSSHVLDGLESRRGMFLAGKMLQGVAIGGLLCTTQTYMSEILPPSLRGAVLAFFPAFTLLGQLAGAVVVFTSLKLPGQRHYTTPMFAQWPFSAVPCLCALLLPESPTYLLRKKKVQAAFKAQARLDTKGMDTQANIDNLTLSLEIEQERAKYDRSSYRECFLGVNRRRTLIVMFANIIPQLFGLALLADASYFIQMVGMSAKNALLFLQLGIGLGLLANIVSMWLLTKLGRRTLMISTFALAGLLWLGMGIAGCFKGIVVIWYTAVTLMVAIVTVGIGAWPASYAVSAETSSLRLRAKTQGLGWFAGGFASGAFGISIPYMYNKDEADLRGKIGFVYTVLCALGCFFTWRFVPEMKERTAVEIDIMFENDLPTRDFKTWTEAVPIERVLSGKSEGSQVPLTGSRP